MKKKGFTLIELLAVIVILAIIALIATPLVLKYIEYSKEKSAKLSAQTYAEAVEKEYVSKLTSNEKMPNKEYTVKELEELGVNVKGDKPEGENDTVTLQNGKVIKYTLTIKDYVIVYEDGKATVESEKDSDSNNSELLDHTVTFMVDGEPYQIVSVKDGGSITTPTPPKKTKLTFASWRDDKENKVVFPYVPTKDEIIVAFFTEHPFISSTDLLYSGGIWGDYKKQNTDPSVVALIDVGDYINPLIISKTENGCKLYRSSSRCSGTIYKIEHNNEVWYYYSGYGVHPAEIGAIYNDLVLDLRYLGDVSSIENTVREILDSDYYQ